MGTPPIVDRPIKVVTYLSIAELDALERAASRLRTPWESEIRKRVSRCELLRRLIHQTDEYRSQRRQDVLE